MNLVDDVWENQIEYWLLARREARDAEMERWSREVWGDGEHTEEELDKMDSQE